MKGYSAAYIAWRAARDALESECSAISARWNAIPGNSSGPCGLTPDAVKSSPAWQECARAYAIAHNALRRHNASGVKRFRRDMAAERDARRAGLERAAP